jgi:D-erythronate 2-dehydrogenase
MHIVITGGAGFLGCRLTERLLRRGTLRDPNGDERAIDRITIVDMSAADDLSDSRVTQITGDVADRTLLERAIDTDATSIFHLAAVVSGQAEADFELGMRVNLDVSRTLLDVCRVRGQRPRVVFTSSVAVYGGTLPDVVTDSTPLTPQSSYGTQKAIAELLIGDYTRKGFVDGRVLRLPTVSVRPGRPNAAASSFASAIIREPLNGEDAVCPVQPSTRIWLVSPETAIASLIAGHEIPSAALESNRAINVPGLSVTVQQMVDSLERIAGQAVVKHIRWERDPRIERIVGTWPGAWDTTRARALGLPMDENFDAIVRGYMEFLSAKRTGTDLRTSS